MNRNGTLINQLPLMDGNISDFMVISEFAAKENVTPSRIYQRIRQQIDGIKDWNIEAFRNGMYIYIKVKPTTTKSKHNENKRKTKHNSKT